VSYSQLQDSNFQTTDTATAAYLCVSNFKLIRIDTDNHQATFIFESSVALKEAAHAFEMGTAIGNINMFFRQYRKLLREVKGGDAR